MVALKGDGVPKIVLITGVSKGLGRALALEMAKKGHTIIGCARSQDRISSLQAELSQHDQNPNHLLVAADVRSDSDIEGLARVVIETRGVPDIIGTINKNNKIWEVPAEEFETIIDTNIKGIANMLRHFLPLMVEKKQGIIVNMSSGWGRSVAAEVAPYCASKWAIEGLTRSVAKELPVGMAIVALNPGAVNTDMLASCFGSSASLYQTPESWAPNAASMILNLTAEDNGAALNV
ncbi:NAD(P)-binding Rossmann-fold superfamily protein isoform X2 [Tasmannia lanceolata]|uniref:NAD(P)-binding Rossmann-fold superfamily protein isoform X2 n=1 Tax=Tasmannia lanceolata TaxID=3420 RepID=UPI004064BEC0